MKYSYRHRRHINQQVTRALTQPPRTKPITQKKVSRFGFSPSNSDRTQLDVLLRSGTTRAKKNVTLPSLGTWGDNADDI